MAASCSNLKRSRTELLASMSNPTRSGRLVSLLKERTLSAGLASSKTLKSFCVRSFTKWPRLSVTVKTTLTSSTRFRMTVRVSSGLSLFAVERSADAVPDLSDAPEVDGCEEAVGGAVTCDEELGSAGVGAAGAGDCAGALDWVGPGGWRRSGLLGRELRRRWRGRKLLLCRVLSGQPPRQSRQQNQDQPSFHSKFHYSRWRGRHGRSVFTTENTKGAEKK